MGDFVQAVSIGGLRSSTRFTPLLRTFLLFPPSSSTSPLVLGMNLYPTMRKVVYVLSILYAVTQPSVLFASSFLAVAAVEISVSVSQGPVGSLVDSAIRHAFGGDG